MTPSTILTTIITLTLEITQIKYELYFLTFRPFMVHQVVNTPNPVTSHRTKKQQQHHPVMVKVKGASSVQGMLATPLPVKDFTLPFAK